VVDKLNFNMNIELPRNLEMQSPIDTASFPNGHSQTQLRESQK